MSAVMEIVKELTEKHEKRIAELELMLERIMHDGYDMIGSGYRSHAQMMLYAEARKLLQKSEQS